jgi:hypothetical protein
VTLRKILGANKIGQSTFYSDLKCSSYKVLENTAGLPLKRSGRVKTKTALNYTSSRMITHL